MTHTIPLVIATGNPGKIIEIQELLSGFPIDIKCLDDFGSIPEVKEDGQTFDENAYKKASFTAKILGIPALADDSGLMVEAHPRRRIANIANGFPHNLRHIHVTVRGNLAGNKRQTGGHQCLAGYSAIFILRHDTVQNRIRYGIGNLVRMTFGHRLGGKKIFFHKYSPYSSRL